MTMILMERMKKALSLALVLLMVFCSVSAVAEELDFVVLEAVDDYGEEAIQLVEMEIQTEEVGEPEQTIELIDLQEAEEPEIQEPEELMAESETIEIVQVTLEEPQEETPVAEESEPIQLTLDSQKRYGVAGLEPIAIDVAVAGGKEPVILTATVSLNGQTVSVEQIPEGTYSYLPWQGGQHTVTVTARDAAGSEVSAQATVPVSAGEYDLDAYNYWVGQLPQLSGSETFAERLLAAAESQVGYTESNDYFIIDSDGVRHGYTVYGDWAGRAYAQWDATFASFCLEGAGIPQEAVPQSGSSAQWVDKLGSRFVRRGSYRPQPGDLVFFTDTANGEANHVGIVRKTVDNDFTTIEGNLDKMVSTKEYSLGDPSILGFMKMEAVMEAYDPQYATPTPAPTATPEPTAEPTATPEPTAEPTATPEPTAEPTATPEPTAEPTATPEPTAEPTATPEPTAEPTATPEPSAEPTVTTEATEPAEEDTETTEPAEEDTETTEPTEEDTETTEPTEVPELLEVAAIETEAEGAQEMQPISLEAQAVTEEATQETVEQVTQEQDASKEGQMEAELILLEEEEALVEAENEGAEAQEQLPLIQAEEPTGPVVLQASLPGSDYVVVVRFDASSGIPLDAQLIVSQILDQERYDRYLENAQSMLNEEEREDLEDFYVLSVSLISGGVDYAGQGGYEVEILMNDAVEAEGMQALSFTDDGPTRLHTNTVVNENETIDRISFNSH